ncbi:hypothetical protein [Streptomyces europaeiscabiei]|uniref:hypothetical protein n=1 Tax=Streptomyces europaeiscabiei TaxID=146819 RepID=UPI0029B67859|nr:hypothetical protein [Streptomyces europaeiscabiei]MDX3666959.1 hypothetical protein [Streptomyces europaeiscabiei]
MITRVSNKYVVLYREEGGNVAYVVPVIGMDSDGIPLVPTLDIDQALYRRMDERNPNYAVMRGENAAMMSAWRAKRVMKDEGYTLHSEDDFRNGTGVQFWWHYSRHEECQTGVPRNVYRHIFKPLKPSDRAAIRRVLGL